MTTSETMTPARSQGSMTGFMPGLVIGLIVGGIAGAVLPDLLTSGMPAPAGDAKASPQGRPREAEPAQPLESSSETDLGAGGAVKAPEKDVPATTAPTPASSPK